jgi:hypothetical protein
VYLEAEDLLPALESFAAPDQRQPGVAVGARQQVSGLFSGNAGVLLTNLDEGTRLTLPASGAYGVGARIGSPVGPRAATTARPTAPTAVAHPAPNRPDRTIHQSLKLGTAHVDSRASDRCAIHNTNRGPHPCLLHCCRPPPSA